MKTAVVYFSLDGNSALIAERISGLSEAALLRLELRDDKQRRGLAKYVWGGRQVMTHQKPALKPYRFDAAAYDLIILGSPVWAGSPAPALASFLAEAGITGKKLGLFCCHAGGKGKSLEKFKALLPGNTIAGEIDFVNPAKQDTSELAEKIKQWLKGLV